MTKMKHSDISFIAVLLGITCLLPAINTQCCLKFNNNECITCPQNMHIYRGNCISNLPNCKSYFNGFDCSECNDGYKLTSSGCTFLAKPSLIPQPQAQTLTPEIKPESKLELKAQSKLQQRQVQTIFEPKDYKQFAISLPLQSSGTNQRSQRASVVDQILRSTYADIRKADILKANDRLYPDNSKVIELVYKLNGPAKSQTLYRGLMVADLDTFIFKEISFKKIDNNPVNADNAKPISGGDDLASLQGNFQKQNSQQSKQPSNQQSAKNDLTKNIKSGPKVDPKQPTTNTAIKFTNAPSQQSSLSSVQKYQPQLQPISYLPTPLTNNDKPSSSLSSTQAPTKASQPSTLSVSNTPQDEYSTIKFIELSDIDALLDINFVAALNEINNKLPELQGLMPTSILAEIGHDSSKMSVVHYVITFEVEDKNKVISVEEVKLKVITQTSQVKIDSVAKKQQKRISGSSSANSGSSSANSGSSSAKSPVTLVEKLSNERLQKRQGYREISGNPQKADIYFLIFQGNLGKGLEKKLGESGKKSMENEILYAGKLEEKEVINYWVQTRVKCVNGSKSVFKVRGSENKLTYDVKIDQIVPVETTNNLQSEKQTKQTKTQAVDSRGANNQKGVSTVIVGKKFQQPKEYISGASATFIALNSAAPVSPIKSDTNTPRNKNVPTIVNALSPNLNPAPQPTLPAPAAIPVPSFVHTVISVPPSPIPTKLQTPFDSKLYTDINQTINSKAGGFDQIDPNSVHKDDGVLRSVESMLTGRPDREKKKLYKAFIKNYGIKAEYKIYLIDSVTKSPRIEITEGYVIYDLLRKRLFVISYGSLGL